MESVDLGGEHSEELMRPPHTRRSKRKRSSLKGESDEGNAPKKLCTAEANLKINSDIIALAEASFIDDLKKDLADRGDLKMVTPSDAENLPRRRKKRSMTPGVDTSTSMSRSRLDVSAVSEKSRADEASGGCNSLELSSVADDSKPLERSGRRKKCTSARVLLGLEKPKTKEATGQSKDAIEVSTETTSVDRKPRMTGPKPKKEVLPSVQHDVLRTSLEVLPDPPAPLSVERCCAVKPDWLKPFKLGWRREIVFRNTVKSPSSLKPLCDVYYFSSDVTKLRSLPQIIDYLTTIKSTLTAECFTFAKCVIYKEPQEMVRSAAFSRGRTTRKTGLLHSNESSMKSFDDDTSSQASSAGTNRTRKFKERIANDSSLKTGDAAPVKVEAPALPVVAETPSVPVMSNIKKEEVSPEAGATVSVDETDKRQAVRAAATLALRTYMSHALRTVNNPLLQSGNLKPSDKDKTASSKSVAKTKSASVQHKNRSSRKSLSPVVALRRLNCSKASDVGSRSQPEEKTKRRKGPPSAVNLAKLHSKRSDEFCSASKSHETLKSKVAKIKRKSLMSAAATSATPGSREKPIRCLKKMSPLKTSTPRSSISMDSPSLAATSFEKINAAIKALMSKQDNQTSQKKLSKSQTQQATPLPSKALSKSKTLPAPVGKVPAKSDAKSNEKLAATAERKPASTPTLFVPKQIESCLNETSRLCGMDCPGRLGIPPTLPCATCMCLFHPECAGYTSHMYFTPAMNFTCWACGKLNKELEKTSYGLYKCDIPDSETSAEASSKTLQKPSAEGKSASERGISAGNMNAVALTSPRVRQASNLASSGADAVAGLEHPSMLDPSGISLSNTSTGEMMVASCGPSAQLLVIPAGLARHLNMSRPLILLADDKEVHVKPEQLKVSGAGLNITLPMGSVPDAFVEGPGKPLEFRVVSSDESGHQAVAVSLFERPCRSSSALEAFSTRKAGAIAVSQSHAVTPSESGITTSTESNITTLDSAACSIKRDTDEGNLDSISDSAAASAEPEEILTSEEAKHANVTSALHEGEASAAAEGECKATDATEDMDLKEDLDCSKSENKTGFSSGMAEAETVNIPLEEELRSISDASNKCGAETKLASSSESGEEVMNKTSMEEEPKTDVVMETERFIPTAGMPVDSISEANTSGESPEGIDDESSAEEVTIPVLAAACVRTDESDNEIIKEVEIALVADNGSETKSEMSHERDGTDTLKENRFETNEPKDEMDSSGEKMDVSSTDVIAVKETTAEPD